MPAQHLLEARGRIKVFWVQTGVDQRLHRRVRARGVCRSKTGAHNTVHELRRHASWIFDPLINAGGDRMVNTDVDKRIQTLAPSLSCTN